MESVRHLHLSIVFSRGCLGTLIPPSPPAHSRWCLNSSLMRTGLASIKMVQSDPLCRFAILDWAQHSDLVLLDTLPLLGNEFTRALSTRTVPTLMSISSLRILTFLRGLSNQTWRLPCSFPTDYQLFFLSPLFRLRSRLHCPPSLSLDSTSPL